MQGKEKYIGIVSGVSIVHVAGLGEDGQKSAGVTKPMSYLWGTLLGFPLRTGSWQVGLHISIIKTLVLCWTVCPSLSLSSLCHDMIAHRNILLNYNSYRAGIFFFGYWNCGSQHIYKDRTDLLWSTMQLGLMAAKVIFCCTVMHHYYYILYKLND